MPAKYYAITIIIAIISLLVIRGCAVGRNTLSQAQIVEFVLDNDELLNQAVEEIWRLDEHIHGVANTRFRPRPGIDFEGLYTSGTLNGQNVVEPLDNPILYQLLEDGRVRSISITRANPIHRTTYRIQFSFNVGGSRYRQGGIYFSKYDEPILFSGRRWTNPETYRNGWVTYGYNFYYTERVLPHWFYYEMLASSNRRPRR